MLSRAIWKKNIHNFQRRSKGRVQFKVTHVFFQIALKVGVGLFQCLLWLVLHKIFTLQESYYLTWKDMSTQVGILNVISSTKWWTAPSKDQYLPNYFRCICDEYAASADAHMYPVKVISKKIVHNYIMIFFWLDDSYMIAVIRGVVQGSVSLVPILYLCQ
jgi:hypothetical protein